MSATLLGPFAFVATGALLLLALAALNPGSAEAGEFCQNLKGELCITLTPDPETNTVGDDHTVTATATVDGDPLGAVFDVLFIVYAGPNAGESGTGSLNDSGTADFTYTGDGGAGTDNIAAAFCDSPGDCQALIDACQSDLAGCVQQIENACTPQIPGRAPGRVVAGINFCFGPATAVKNWVDPSPTPSPTPVDVGGGGQAPSPTPTPAGLPDTGGSPSDDAGIPRALALLALAVAGGAGTFAVARRVVRR
jgi:hypothetical protein